MITTPEEKPNLDYYEERRLHMERLYRVKLFEYDLPMAVLMALERHGIRTIGDLCNLTRKELRSIHRIGDAAMMAINMFLIRYNLALKGEKRPVSQRSAKTKQKERNIDLQ